MTKEDKRIENRPVYESPKVSSLESNNFANGQQPVSCRPGSSADDCGAGAGGTIFN